MKPMFSIIIPTYNRAYIISKTLESVKMQTFANWECIIVDDHSDDNTYEVVCAYVNEDSRFRYVLNQRKKGAQGARNTGIICAESDWICFFDSDNYMYTNFLMDFYAIMSDEKDVYTCFSAFVDCRSGEKVRSLEFNCIGNIHKALFDGTCYVDNNNSIIRKKKLIEICYLDEDCPSMQEWDTHIRLSKICQYETISKTLLNYFVGADDAISYDKKREVIGRLYILKKHKKEWVSYRRAGVNFFKQIKKYIAVVDDESFRRQANKNLVRIVPIIYVRYILNKPFEYINCQVRRVIDHFKYIRSIKKDG